jgi:histidinol-phosphate aminotransferase
MDITKIQHILKLSQNENPFGPSPLALKAVLENSQKMSQYPEAHSQSLKTRIAQKFDRDVDHVFISAGMIESLDILIRNFIAEDENMVIPEISFVAYKLLADVFNKEARMAKMKNFHVDVDQLLSLCDKKTKAIILANPNNPTGTVISESELIRILKHVPESTLVVMDEAYIEYCDQDKNPNSLKWQKDYPNLIVMRTFSKIFGLAGLRIGYTIATKELIQRLDYYQAPFMVNQVAAIAAHEALNDDEFVHMSVSSNQKCRDKLFAKFVASGYDVIPSESNFLFINFDYQENRDYLFDQLKRKNVMVRKTDMFGAEKGLRITVGTPEMNDLVIQYIDGIEALQ